MLPARVAWFQWRARRLARRLGDQFSLSSATRPPKLALILDQARGCRRIAELGSGTAWTSISLLLVDPGRELVTSDPHDRLERERYLELAGRHVADRLTFVHGPGAGGPSDERRFDLLFIDSSHALDETIAEFEVWRPSLTDGALVIFDDYGHPQYPGVQAAVEALGLTGHSDSGLFFHRLSRTDAR